MEERPLADIIQELWAKSKTLNLNRRDRVFTSENLVHEWVQCCECGDRVLVRYTQPTQSQMLQRKLCFACNFWMEKLVIKDDPGVARIDGRHYIIKPPAPPGEGGFGGAAFTIRFLDGRTVTTNNLWHQGEIPHHFKERLPDNAVFVGRDTGFDSTVSRRRRVL